MLKQPPKPNTIQNESDAESSKSDEEKTESEDSVIIQEPDIKAEDAEEELAEVRNKRDSKAAAKDSARESR